MLSITLITSVYQSLTINLLKTFFGKMNPLKLNRFVLEFVGVCVVEENTPSSIKIRNKWFYLLMIVMHIINMSTSGLYLIVCINIDFVGGLYSLLAESALICNLNTLITLRYYFMKMRTIFTTIGEIYRECKIKADYNLKYFK